MQLLVVREMPLSAGLPYTHGKLYAINGGHKAFICYTLEDQVRPLGSKVYGKTAIPAGTYKISVTMSPKFKKELPLLADVPGFDGVRIHGGNYAGLEKPFKYTPKNTQKAVLYTDEYVEVFND